MPGFLLRIKYRSTQPWVDSCELGTVLTRQFGAVRKNAGLGIRLGQQAAGHGREHDGLS